MNLNPQLLYGAVVLVLLFGAVFWTATTRRGFLLLGVAFCVVAAMSALGAWYAWAESKLMHWTIGYMVVCGICLILAVRQFSRRW